MDIIYRAITKDFLSKFDLYWQDSLKKLEIDGHPQFALGNRFRPQLCLWGYLSTIDEKSIENHDYSLIANVAVSVELIHKASILLDDWIDDDNERHGKPAFHIEYSPEETVLVALSLVTYSLERLEPLLSENIILPSNYLLGINSLIKTIHGMAIGALSEIKLSNLNIFDRKKIISIIDKETSLIISNSFLLGYYIGAGESVHASNIEFLDKIGRLCGFIFQSYNDLEAFANPKELICHKGGLNIDFSKKRKNIVICTLHDLIPVKKRTLIYEFSFEQLLDNMHKYKVFETLLLELNSSYNDLISLIKTTSIQFDNSNWTKNIVFLFHSIKEKAENQALKE